MKFKNNTATLDVIDIQILVALEKNARQTYTAIGKSLGISHSTVYDRMKRMERYGIIKIYTVVVDAEKVGSKNIIAIMTLFTDPKESERVAEKICEASETLEVYTSLSEEFLIIVKVVTEDQESLHEFIASSVAPLPGVLRIRTSIVTKKFKETQVSIANSLKQTMFREEKHIR